MKVPIWNNGINISIQGKVKEFSKISKKVMEF